MQVTRGTTGGCKLIIEPAEVSLFQVLCATGEEHLVNACTDCEYECDRRKEMEDGCSIHCKLCEIQTRLDSLLKEYTLADLLTKQPNE